MNLSALIGETTEYDKKQAVEAKKPKSWCKSVGRCGVQERGLGFRQADIRTVILLARVDERLVTQVPLQTDMVEN